MEAEHNRVDIQDLQDQLVAKYDDHNRIGRNPTQYTTESQQYSLEPFIQQLRASPHTYTPKSSWREICYALTPRSSWRETLGHEQEPFKTILNPPINEIQSRRFPPFYLQVHKNSTTPKMEMIELGKIQRDFKPQGLHQSIHDSGELVLGEHGRTLQTLFNHIDEGGLGMILFLAQEFH